MATETITVNSEEFEIETLRKVNVTVSVGLYNMLEEHLHLNFDEYRCVDIFSPHVIKEALEETEDDLIVEEYNITEEDKQDLKTILALFEEHGVDFINIEGSL